MGIILDIILIVIVAIYIFLSVKKGFVRSLIEVVGYVLSIILALSLGNAVANYIYDNHIEKAATTAIQGVISDKSSDAIEAIPDYVISFLEKANVDLSKISNTENTDISQITDAIRPFAVGVLKSISSLLFFIVLLIIVKVLAKFLNSLFKGIVFGTANKVLGGALGAVKGLIFASIFSVIVYLIASVTTKQFFIFTDEAINGSVICKNIIQLLVGSL